MKILRTILIAIIVQWASMPAAFAIDTLDLDLRSEQTVPLTANQFDTNMSEIETAVNALIAVVDITDEYGEMYVAANASATAVSVASTYYKVSVLLEGQSSTDCTFASAAFTCPAGDYLAQCSVSMTGGNTDIVGIGFLVDGTVDPNHIIRRKLATTGSDVGAASVSAVLTVDGTEDVALGVANYTDTDDVTITYATCIMRGIQ